MTFTISPDSSKRYELLKDMEKYVFRDYHIMYLYS